MPRKPSIIIEADRRIANRVWVHTIATEDGEYIAHYARLSALLAHLAAHDIDRVLIVTPDAEYYVAIDRVSEKG